MLMMTTLKVDGRGRLDIMSSNGSLNLTLDATTSMYLQYDTDYGMVDCTVLYRTINL
jgi:hypothetical protein